jgi:hypothetical protein
MHGMVPFTMNAWGSKKNCLTQKLGFVAFAGNKINFTTIFCFLV